MTRVWTPSGVQERFLNFSESKILCWLTVCVSNPSVLYAHIRMIMYTRSRSCSPCQSLVDYGNTKRLSMHFFFIKWPQSTGWLFCWVFFCVSIIHRTLTCMDYTTGSLTDHSYYRCRGFGTPTVSESALHFWLGRTLFLVLLMGCEPQVIEFWFQRSTNWQKDTCTSVQQMVE